MGHLLVATVSNVSIQQATLLVGAYYSKAGHPILGFVLPTGLGLHFAPAGRDNRRASPRNHVRLFPRPIPVPRHGRYGGKGADMGNSSSPQLWPSPRCHTQHCHHDERQFNRHDTIYSARTESFTDTSYLYRILSFELPHSDHRCRRPRLKTRLQDVSK